MFLASSLKGAYQIYFTDIVSSFNVGRADFALSGSIFMLMIGIMSPIVGAMSDRLGPLRTVLTGSLVAGLTFVAMSVLSASLSVFIVAYGVFAAFALTAMTYVPMGVLVDRLFAADQKGMAYAIVTNGTSIGFIVLSPFWVWLEPHLSWQSTFLGIGLAFLIPISLVLWAISRTPVPVKPSDAAEAAPGTWKGVLSDPRFYILAASFLSCGATMGFIDVHLVPFWQNAEVRRVAMGASLSLLGILELISGLLAGALATRYSKNLLLGGFYILRSLSVLMLLSSNSIVMTYLFAACFGISYLGTVILTSTYCLDLYGPQIKGRAFGAIFFVHQVGAFAVVQGGAASFDATHSYNTTIMAMLFLTCLATVLSIGLLPSRSPRPALP
jgi:predicted MFS family arabinose efflux permease